MCADRASADARASNWPINGVAGGHRLKSKGAGKWEDIWSVGGELIENGLSSDN